MKRKEPEKSDAREANPSKKGFWAMGLLKTMKDPKYMVKTDDKVTVIKDMYNKAKYHYLVLPNDDISNLKALNKDQVSLLEHMDKIGKEYVTQNHPNTNFKYGYHAEASMHRLHLHVISDDMNSSCLKTKKHWNSFTTDFFIDSKDIIENLKKNGKIQLPPRERCKEYLETPLKCHKCNHTPKNMPELKKHILSHLD